MYEDLITTKEAAKILGVTPSRVRQLLRQNLLGGHRLPAGLWLISNNDLAAYVETRRTAGRPRKVT
jgi:excisionase family DNA binding protein